MGSIVKSHGELVIKDYKTGVIIAIGELIDFQAITYETEQGKTKEFHVYARSYEPINIEKSGSLKESAGEKISHFTEIEDKG